MRPTITCDGAGGAIVAWDDLRAGTNTDVYAQRLNAAGATLWATNGTLVCAAAKDQTRPTLCPDGNSGAIIAWEDRRGSNADVYAQRMGATGTAQWSANGIAVCTAAGDQLAPLSVADGAGGMVVAWKDARSGNVDLYAHRLGASGGTPTGVRGPGATPALAVAPGYPNPFAHAIRFDLHMAERNRAVTMDVFDVTGRRVARRAVPGDGATFDGRDDTGRLLPSGIYLFRFAADDATVTRKAVIAR
jgi:hypothetical protein